jgi:hypothetical protein
MSNNTPRASLVSPEKAAGMKVGSPARVETKRIITAEAAQARKDKSKTRGDADAEEEGIISSILSGWW